jgi:hypothetical protein
MDGTLQGCMVNMVNMVNGVDGNVGCWDGDGCGVQKREGTLVK